MKESQTHAMAAEGFLSGPWGKYAGDLNRPRTIHRSSPGTEGDRPTVGRVDDEARRRTPDILTDARPVELKVGTTQIRSL
jgi:hypothetical protein